MATTPASDGECSITVEPAARACGSMPWREKELRSLSQIAFCVALLEWVGVGDAIGALAMLWATVILLGGFCSLLNPMDFWFSAVMIFMEATRCAVAVSS